MLVPMGGRADPDGDQLPLRGADQADGYRTATVNRARTATAEPRRPARAIRRDVMISSRLPWRRGSLTSRPGGPHRGRQVGTGHGPSRARPWCAVRPCPRALASVPMVSNRCEDAALGPCPRQRDPVRDAMSHFALYTETAALDESAVEIALKTRRHRSSAALMPAAPPAPGAGLSPPPRPPRPTARSARPTPPALLAEARGIGREAGLRYVYVERALGPEGRGTSCPGCGLEVVSRDVWATRRNAVVRGACPRCHEVIPGRW
jgi:hypothetical protein